MNKQYGLIIKKKENNVIRKSLFEEEDEDLHGECVDEKSYFTSKNSKNEKLNRKALNEDSNIYAYDEIYDEMKKGKNVAQSNVKKESKYIQKLVKAAEYRKIEEQRRIDKKIEKERLLEGDTFNDKETFVTEAYRQKLIERKIFDEMDRKEQELEEMMDVRKQNDFTGFYKHFLSQKVGEEKMDGNITKKFLNEITQDYREKLFKENEIKETNLNIDFRKPRLNQTKRLKKDSSSENEDNEDKDEISLIKKCKKKILHKEESNNLNFEDKEDKVSSDSDSEASHNEYLIETTSNDKTNKQLKDENNEEEKPKVEFNLREVLSELFKKKCVGELFVEEQKKYYQRKNE